MLFHLKGSRDPYSVQHEGAGLVKAFTGDVRVRLGWSNHAREFFQIDSQRYLLGVPDLAAFVDRAATGAQRPRSRRSDSSSERLAAASMADSDDLTGATHAAARDLKLIKVLLKLSGSVRWGMGIQLERTCRNHGDHDDQPIFLRPCRLYTFKPHYKVQTRTREGMGSVCAGQR